MSLYHKYRPASFEDVVGNEGVVKAVVADLAKNDPPHAFLFHGPTGCGKTTLGRIVARILGSVGGDFREVDSADFRGIDTIRELRKQSAFKPLEGKCKVWLIDECFVKGTYVDTPWGGVPIESIRKNHIIYSLAGEDKVVETFEKKIPLSRLVKLTTEDNREIYCSNTHQFFTPQGWVTAQDMVGSFTYSFSRSIMEDITLRKKEGAENGVSTVPCVSGPDALLSETKGAIQQEVLQPKLPGEGQTDSCGISGEIVQPPNPSKDSARPSALLAKHPARLGGTEENKQPDGSEQPHVNTGKHRKGEEYKADQGNSSCMERGTWGKREIDAPSNTASSSPGVGNRNSDTPEGAERNGIPQPLQSRRGELVIEDSHRSGWVWAQYEKRYQARHEENSEAQTVRVEGVEIYKPGYNDQSFARVVGDTERAQGYIILYDIQVEKHPSYFANGLAVHNCHKLTNDAQNALLKALEDAPTHVYYILATTDPQKLLPTIRGRCSQYQVSLLNETQMLKLLRSVVKAEGEKLPKEVYEQIIQDSQGHPRNALQILDQVLGVDENMRLEVAKKSAETQSQAIELCRALMSNSGWKKVSSILSGLTDEDPESIRRMVLGYCNTVLLRGENMKAGLIMENFIEPFYNSGWPGLTFACYSIVAGE